MSSVFRLLGSYTADPAGSSSLQSAVGTPLDVTADLAAKHVDEIELDSDATVGVAFGGLDSAEIVILEAIGSKVVARLTSADGAVQSIPVDPLLILISKGAPITAIDLTRKAGEASTVGVFLGSAA
jgi:hypothetical protein